MNRIVRGACGERVESTRPPSGGGRDSMCNRDAQGSFEAWAESAAAIDCG